MRPSTDGPLFLTYTCDWTVNQPTNLLVLCPFSYSTLLCSALLYFQQQLQDNVLSLQQSSKRNRPGWQENQQVCPKRIGVFERSSESPLLFTPSLPLRSLPLGCCRPAYYSALLVALSLAQPSPAQPLKQSINHSLLDLAPRRRLFSCTNRTGLYCTSRTKGDGKQPLYTSPLLAKTATPFSPLALKLN